METDIETDRQTDRQIDRQNRENTEQTEQTDQIEQTDQTDRQRDRIQETDSHTDTWMRETDSGDRRRGGFVNQSAP
jgi:hypothetical protein